MSLAIIYSVVTIQSGESQRKAAGIDYLCSNTSIGTYA